MHPLDLPRALVDFETFSELDVRDVGAYKYAEHPSTEVLCMGYKMPGKQTRLWVDPKVWPLSDSDLEIMEKALGPGVLHYGDFPSDLREHIEAGNAVEAHHAGFERAIFHRVLYKRYGIPYPKRMVDTQATCASRSLPLALDDVGDVLNLPIQKDKMGKKYIQALCSPRKPTKKDPSLRSRDIHMFAGLCKYCVVDVDAEHVLGETIGDLTPSEYAVWNLDQKINNRGVAVDMDAVLKATIMSDKITERLEQELREITGYEVKTGSEVKKIKEWCQANGLTGLADLTAGTVEDMLKMGWIPADVRRVLEIRQELSRASAKKLVKFRECTNEDGRIRGLLQFHGAGTGRWAGRLVQPQNFPRGSVDNIEQLLSIIKMGDPEILELHYGSAFEGITSALRGNFIAGPGMNLYVADFSAIEARVVMWLADCEAALEVFHKFDRGEGPDIYCHTAGHIYQRTITKKDKDERQLGKITVLGCGYQMSGPRLKEQAEDSYGVSITEDRAIFLVDTFRKTYKEVPKLWRALEEAAIKCVREKNPNAVEIVGKVKFQYVHDKAGRWMTIILPNGRRLWYNEPGLEEKTIPYKDKETGEMKTFTKDSLFYHGRDNKMGGVWNRVFTYGGMLTENIVQAIARDLMVEAMFRVEAKGYEIILTVHDELVAESEFGDIKEFTRLVAGPVPKWAEGCPVEAEGWTGKRYRK